MPGFDYDVVIIGSGFGGSVAALRAARRATTSASWRQAGAGRMKRFVVNGPATEALQMYDVREIEGSVGIRVRTTQG